MSKRLFCSMNMGGKHMGKVPVLMGLAFYLQIVYYFGFTRMEQMGLGSMILMLILPALLELGFVVMMRGIRFNNPMVYGAMGMVYCLILMIQSFTCGSVLRIVLSCVIYLACMGLIAVAVLKILNKWFAVGALLTAAAVQFFVFDLVPYVIKFKVIKMIPKAATICGLIALAIMFYYLEIRAKRK